MKTRPIQFSFAASFSANHTRSLHLWLELAIIVLWALAVAFPYMDFRPEVLPSGNEYLMSLQNHYQWPLFLRCGLCFLWNGSTNGGAPAFIDTHGSWLHPISVVSTWLLGVVSGGKLVFWLSLVMAGMAQYWLGYLLRLKRPVRLWGALVVVAAGHLAGKMDNGSLALVLSTAACSLAIPAAWQLLQQPNYRNCCLLAAVAGCAALAGQGYLQITLAASLAPAIGYFLLQSHSKKLGLRPVWRWFVLAMALAILVASVLLVPLARHLPNLSKDGDVTFSSAQPLRFMVLNLVIDDPDYHFSEILDKHPYPYLSNNYIGWIPLLLALLAPIMATPHQRPFMIAAGIALVMIYLVSSALLLQWLMYIPWPILQEFLTGMRNPAVGQGLAVPLMVAAATISLNGLLSTQEVNVQLTMSDNDTPVVPIRLPLIKVVLALLMVASLGSLFSFARVFLATYEEDGTRLRPLIQELDSSQAQWVQPVFGEHFWLPFAMQQDLKIRWYFRPWGLKHTQPLPPAYRELSRVPEDAQLPEYVKTVDDILILARPDYPYAYVKLNDGYVPCQAQALGGHIDVVCDTDTDGTLVVLEHAVGGWRASLAGQRLPLKTGPWLSVAAPAGTTTYQFRYRPADVLIGVVCSLVGWCLVLLGIWRGQPPRWLAKAIVPSAEQVFPPPVDPTDNGSSD